MDLFHSSVAIAFEFLFLTLFTSLIEKTNHYSLNIYIYIYKIKIKIKNSK